MSLLQSYQEILDKSFRQHFNDWDKMSAWDPIKLFAESVTGSFAEIENRQRRLTSTLMDSLPSLLGFEMSQARLPAGMVGIVASPKLKIPHVFPAGARLRFNQEEGAVYLRFVRDFALQPGEEIQFAEMELLRVEADLTLGVLQGEPWESLALSDEIVVAPQTLVLRFPDEQTKTLHLGSDELLRVRKADPQAFQNFYFYNGIRHELVFPGASDLLKGYRGGVSVQAQDIALRPASDWIVSGTFANDLPKVIASAELGLPTRAFIARETPDAYLTRFYALVRAIPARNPPVFLPAEICQELVGTEPRIRKVEHSYDSALMQSVFHVLMGTLESGVSKQEQQEILANANEFLASRVPLSHPFRVEVFKTTRLQIAASGSVDDEKLQSSLDSLVQPKPFGSLEVGTELPTGALERQIRAALGVAVHLRVYRGQEGIFQTAVSRAPGERFEVCVGKERVYA